jgi:hypothetical protein
MKPKPITVTLPDELIEECKEWAAEIVAHYRSNGSAREAMPWTSDQFTDEECRQWMAGRKEAGRRIDPETCEIAWWHVNESDPYGLWRVVDPTVSDEAYEANHQVGRSRWVRSPDSDGWVNEQDLSVEQYQAIQNRIDRERASKMH